MEAGKTNNPNGRPYKFDTYQALFDELMTYTEAELNLLEHDEAAPIKIKMCVKMAREAIAGKLRAAEMIMDRVDGKPTQPIEEKNKDFNITISNPDFDNV